MVIGIALVVVTGKANMPILTVIQDVLIIHKQKAKKSPKGDFYLTYWVIFASIMRKGMLF